MQCLDVGTIRRVGIQYGKVRAVATFPCVCMVGAKRKENVCYMLDPHSTDVAIGLIR
jgi:hypothetical protein